MAVARRLLLALLAVCALVSVVASPGAAQSAAGEPGRPTFTLLVVNDIYKMNGVDGRGGFARLAAIVRAERARGVPVIYAHAGDMFSPSLMSGFDQGAHTVELLNVVPPDVFVPGNHEFDFGPAIYAKRRAESRFAYFAANLRGRDGEPLAGHEDHRIFQMGPLKVGVFGVTLATSPLMSQTGDLHFGDEMATVKAQAAVLRGKGADLVIAVTHTDFTRDLEIARSRLVDVLATGHDHDLRVGYDNGVVMVESGEEAEYVTAVDIHADIRERDGKRTVKWRPRFRIIDSATVEPDPATLEVVVRLEGDLKRELDVELGKADVELDTRSSSVRSGETIVGNLVADAVRAATKAQVAIINGGGLRGNRLYAVGHRITRRDVLSEMPFGNKTVLVEMTGKDLMDALENGFSDLDNRGGRFPQVSGLSVTVDTKAQSGRHVIAALVDGTPIDPAARYRVASNDFLLRGGDGYRSFARGRVLIGKTDGELIANLVMAHIRRLGTVTGKLEGRIVLK